jgi:putative endonuclease
LELRQKHKMVKGFTYDFRVHKLLYYEVYESIEAAITREKQLKNWHRDWKLNLIKSTNPEFKDLYQSIL